MTILIIATLILILHWALEYRRHSKNVASIPIRIHVNGTRGKSSVTRLIAAGFRAGGLRTIAKITGTLPRMVLHDGREAAIIRLQGANIIEQKYIFRHAAKEKPDAIVIECMAVNPIFQWITERKFVKSTISVITNCRPDHLDLMGSTVQSVTMSLANTIPVGGICFTSEHAQFHILKKVADARKCKISRPDHIEVSPEDLAKFRHIEHIENVQLALAVCAEAGIPHDIALKGMQEARPDPGALRKYIIPDRGKEIHFYNVFAANDPESTVYIINMVTALLTQASTIVILNSRADRLFRSQQLVDCLANVNYDYLLLTGEIHEKVEAYALSHGVKREKLIALGQPLPEKVYQKVWELTDKEAHVLGIGNIAGEIKYGAQIVANFKHKIPKVTKGADRG
ncbi:MAG: poly-gamma-glutamate synthase PgsB [Candidatus Cloacimonadaceae bacterium]|jgi:poly-gamma-glutamate synthase PgsB/CapB|nr:poly-gamma-glutamate synthase PgsB [Candidatus Cloacimonadota bacterium]MDY0128363.1 poly-gamma-glutamate synthase PgsB [Candidatus Cloacimonadaceae bacterium]MCB5254866.1 poly-gamma-glutamate synthase PgsB [Candidatus Cloacimonadota bacterium]MCK9177923.1 poly-gamma-glutamate synthase PgsB [Candidatus Cloacimonadota bacterium]MCK9242329.1 poly-gamma-glutamate synthase PgsB [Candidatus Cloacimonadota bacterium]